MVELGLKFSCSVLPKIHGSFLWTPAKLTNRVNKFAISRRDGVVVRAYASQSVDLGFISQVESYQKT